MLLNVFRRNGVLERFVKKIRAEEWLGIAALFGSAVFNSFVFQNDFSPREVFELMVRYFTFGDYFFGAFVLFIYCLCFFKFYIKLAKIVSDRIVKKIPFPKGSSRELVRHLFEPLRAALPLALLSIPIYTLLSNFNYAFRFQGKDHLLLFLDQKMTGTIPFLVLPTAFPEDWVTTLLYVYYISLTAVLSFLLIFLSLQKSIILFRKAMVAFMISTLIAFCFFYFIPCQDPNNTYIRNIRSIAISPEMKASLEEYRPSEKTKKIIEGIARSETNTNRENTVPVSCFPSMHATWSFLTVYFLTVLLPWSLLVSLPWLILLLLGGVYFAQHYVIDYLIAVPVAMISLWISHKLIHWKERR